MTLSLADITPMQHIGVISDTHGLLRPQAVAALRGSPLIIHAGDVGRPEILDELRRIAPVFAVRGNVDRGSWAMELAETEIVKVEDCLLYVLHDLNALDLDPPTAGFRAVIAGHSHQPRIATKDGVLYFNPGSAGPRRFRLPVSVGRLTLSDGKLAAEIIELEV
jgi:putative phosphoesterase